MANDGCFGQPFLVEWLLVADVGTRPPVLGSSLLRTTNETFKGLASQLA